MIKIFYAYISLAKTIFIIMKFKKNDYYYENLNYYHAYLQGNLLSDVRCMGPIILFINV